MNQWQRCFVALSHYQSLVQDMRTTRRSFPKNAKRICLFVITTPSPSHCFSDKFQYILSDCLYLFTCHLHFLSFLSSFPTSQVKTFEKKGHLHLNGRNSETKTYCCFSVNFWWNPKIFIHHSFFWEMWVWCEFRCPWTKIKGCSPSVVQLSKKWPKSGVSTRKQPVPRKRTIFPGWIQGESGSPGCIDDMPSWQKLWLQKRPLVKLIFFCQNLAKKWLLAQISKFRG